MTGKTKNMGKGKRRDEGEEEEMDSNCYFPYTGAVLKVTKNGKKRTLYEKDGSWVSVEEVPNEE